jgi:predicted MFS family arabinose efflux permease
VTIAGKVTANAVTAVQPRVPLATGRPATALSGAYSGYIVAMFAIVSMLCIADRFVLSILLEPIKTELGASDTVMGILSGAAYSIVFALVGLPVARLADTGNRRTLMAVAVAIWSAATALCGMAGSIVQLFIARTGVAAAESAVQPTLVSMIGDLFSPARRGLAIALSMLGGSIGIALGAVIGGAVAAAHGWRMAFIVVGLPGILFALLFWLTVPEPLRGSKDGGVSEDAETATAMRTLRYLAGVPTSWKLIIASVLLLSTQGAWGAWLPTFFLRVHHLTMGQMSASFGMIMGISAVSSMVISGFLSDWLAKRGERWRITFIGGTLLVGTPFVTAALLVDDVWLSWACIVAFQLVTAGAPPVIAAAGLGVIRPRARALWTSLYNLSGYAIGSLLGPLLVGVISDRITHAFGDAALRYALLVIPALLVPSATAYFWASRTADRDARRVTEPGGAAGA